MLNILFVITQRKKLCILCYIRMSTAVREIKNMGKEDALNIHYSPIDFIEMFLVIGFRVIYACTILIHRCVCAIR